jgi:hypothetical protein
VNTQTKLIHHRENMIEDVGLNLLIFCPDHRVGEGVYFNRQAVGIRRQLAHHQGHIFANARVVTQIFIQVGAEGADIGHLAQV